MKRYISEIIDSIKPVLFIAVVFAMLMFGQHSDDQIKIEKIKALNICIEKGNDPDKCHNAVRGVR